MEVFLRCDIPDVPGRLAVLAGAIGEAGGDIQAVEVVQARDGRVTDDLWVRSTDLSTLLDRIRQLDDARIVHTGPSRGLPGDATARLATGIDALLSGAMHPEDGLPTLVGGVLRADVAELVAGPVDRPPRNGRTLGLPVAGGILQLTRDYRFLDAEIQRAHQVLAVCERAAAIAASGTDPL